jgi:hypothetical protein
MFYYLFEYALIIVAYYILSRKKEPSAEAVPSNSVTQERLPSPNISVRFHPASVNHYQSSYPTNYVVKMKFLRDSDVSKYVFPTLPVVPPLSTSPPLTFPVSGFTSNVLRHSQQMSLLANASATIGNNVNTLRGNQAGLHSPASHHDPSLSLPASNSSISIITPTKQNASQNTRRLMSPQISRNVIPSENVRSSTGSFLASTPGNRHIRGKYVSYSFDSLKNPDEAAHFMVDVNNGVVLSYTVDMYVLLRLLGSLTFEFFFSILC